MGYSKSKRAIRRVESYLAQLVEAQHEVKFDAEDASKTAYLVREGIYASQFYALDANNVKIEPYVSYASLGAKYIVRAVKSQVVCELRDVVFVASPKTILGQLTIPDVSDVLGILGAAIMHKAPVMVFTDASSDTIDDVAKNRLWVWTHANSYFLIIGDNHVTLTKADPGALVWNP